MTYPDELAELINASFGDGPPPSPLAEVIRNGQRRLLGRRLAMGMTALAVTVVTGTLVGAVATSGGSAASGYVSEPTSTPTPTPPAPAAPSGRLPGVRFGPGNQVVVPPGTRIVDRIDNPLGRVAPARSVAVEVESHGRKKDHLLDYAGNGAGFDYSAPANASYGLRDFVDRTLEVAPDRVGPHLAEFSAPTGLDDHLVPAGGARILHQVADPDAGHSFHPIGTARTAAAVVTFHHHRYYVLARQTYETGGIDYVAIPASTGGRTLTDFLAHARSVYDTHAGHWQ